MHREKLLQIGWNLYNIDTVQEKNFAGLNKIDYANWPFMINGTDRQIAKIVYKYRKQYENTLDAGEIEEIEALAKSDAHSFVKLSIGNGLIIAKICGDRNKTVFKTYLETCKAYGFRYDATNQSWYFKYATNPTWLPTFVKVFHEAKVELAIETIEEKPEKPEEPVRKCSTVKVYKRNDGKYSFKAPYNEKLVELFSNKSGKLSGITEYDPNTKERLTTSISLVNEAIAYIQVNIGELDISVDPIIVKDSEEYKKQQEFFKQPIPEITKYLNPEFTLYPHQNEAIHFLNKTEGKALVSYQMGLGKTVITLGYAAMNNLKVLVVCPKVVRRTWIQEAQKFFPSYFTKSVELISKNYKKVRPDLKGCQITTVNYESADKFEQEIIDGGFDVIVIDESHRAKDGKTKTAKLLLNWSTKFAHRILLTGTSIKNEKSELFTQISMIDPTMFHNKNEVKYETTGGLWHKLQQFYIVKTRKEALNDLPESTTQLIDVELEKVPTEPTCFEEIARCKNELALAMVPETLDMVNNILENSEDCILVFSDCVEAAQSIAESLGDIAILHHGQQSDEVREFAKARFQEDDCPARVFVSTRQSLAVGATLTRANHVIFNDKPWNFADIAQAESRVIRIGQKKAIMVYWMTASNSIFDSRITDLIKKKYALNKALCEGKTLTEEEKKYLEEKIDLNKIFEIIRKKQK